MGLKHACMRAPGDQSKPPTAVITHTPPRVITHQRGCVHAFLLAADCPQRRPSGGGRL